MHSHRRRPRIPSVASIHRRRPGADSPTRKAPNAIEAGSLHPRRCAARRSRRVRCVHQAGGGGYDPRAGRGCSRDRGEGGGSDHQRSGQQRAGHRTPRAAQASLLAAASLASTVHTNAGGEWSTAPATLAADFAGIDKSLTWNVGTSASATQIGYATSGGQVLLLAARSTSGDCHFAKIDNSSADPVRCIHRRGPRSVDWFRSDGVSSVRSSGCHSRTPRVLPSVY
jgi:hypothetical protein